MKASQVRRVLNVTQQTLRNYIKQGKLHPIRLSQTKCEYDDDEVYGLIGKRQAKERIGVTYGRVSTSKQRGDLERQNERLMEFAAANGIAVSRQISDVKSGMEFRSRKGFLTLLGMVFENRVKTVVVEHRDRLTRFGFDLVEEIFRLHGTEIMVMTEVDNRSYEQELTDDLISIIHYYSMKSYSNRRKLHNAEKALREDA